MKRSRHHERIAAVNDRARRPSSRAGAAAGLQQQPLAGVGGDGAETEAARLLPASVSPAPCHSPDPSESNPPLAGAGAGNREGTASGTASLAPSTGRAESPAARSSSGADSGESPTAIAGSGAEDMEGVGVAPALTGPSAASGDRPDQHQRRSDQ